MKLIILAALLSLSFEPAFALDNSTTNKGLSWSTCNVRQCKNACVDTYPNGGGPLTTCKKLCDSDACSVVFLQKNNTRKVLDKSPAVLAPAN